MISSGLKGLDSLLGGGYCVGRLCVFIEDGMTNMHERVLANFASGCLHYSYALALALPTVPAGDFLRDELPNPSAAGRPMRYNEQDEGGDLTIAWRYRKKSSELQAISPIQRRLLTDEPARVSELGYPELKVDTLVTNVEMHCERASKEGVLACVCIGSLGKLWADGYDLEESLRSLRRIARESKCVIVATVGSSTLLESVTLNADTVIKMNAYDDSWQAKSRHRRTLGMAVMEKAPHIVPGTWLGRRGDVYTYRPSRKGIAFEAATIEPEMDGDTDAAAAVGCGSGRGGGDSVGGVDF